MIASAPEFTRKIKEFIESQVYIRDRETFVKELMESLEKEYKLGYVEEVESDGDVSDMIGDTKSALEEISDDLEKLTDLVIGLRTRLNSFC